MADEEDVIERAATEGKVKDAQVEPREKVPQRDYSKSEIDEIKAEIRRLKGRDPEGGSQLEQEYGVEAHAKPLEVRERASSDSGRLLAELFGKPTVTKSAERDGGILEVTITVKNNLNRGIRDVAVTDALPEDAKDTVCLTESIEFKQHDRALAWSMPFIKAKSKKVIHYQASSRVGGGAPAVLEWNT